jgi:hypothetical protein
MKKNTFYYLLIALGFIAACSRTDLGDFELDNRTATWAVPLLYGDLKINDLVNNILVDSVGNDSIIVNPDQTIQLIYTGDVSEGAATNIFQFFKNALLPLTDSMMVIQLQTQGIIIQQADLKSGKFTVVLSNTTTDTLTGTYTIPTLLTNGIPYSVDYMIPPASTPWSHEILAAGRQLISTDGSIRVVNYTYNEAGTRIELEETLFASVIQLKDIEFSYVQGYWGKTEFPFTSGAIDININQTNLQGEVKVKNPKVRMTVFNSFGFPVRGIIKKLNFIDQNAIPLQSSYIDPTGVNGIDFAYPALNEVGAAAPTYFDFDANTSNIADIFNSQPVRMEYDVVGISNPNADPSIIGFMTDSSKVRLNLRVELLLEGQMKDFAADQTFDLNFGQAAGDSEGLEEAIFKLVTENTMPMGAKMQLYFQDNNAQNIDSLFQNGLQEVIAGAPVDGSGEVTGEKGIRVNEIPMSAERFNRLRASATKALLNTRFTTSGYDGNTSVVFKANQGTIVKLGVKVKTNE